MFIMIEGELLNMDNVTAVTPDPSGFGCVVQFVGVGVRYYQKATPEHFAQAVIGAGAHTCFLTETGEQAEEDVS